MIWSNDDKRVVQNKFQLCWKKDGETLQQCNIVTSLEPKISRHIFYLQTATKYVISVARYTKDEKTLGRKRQDVAITRSG